MLVYLLICSVFSKKVQVGKDQEKAQSEKDSHSKNRGGKKPNQQSGIYTMKTFRKPNEQLIIPTSPIFLHSDWLFGRLYTSIKATHKNTRISP